MSGSTSTGTSGTNVPADGTPVQSFRLNGRSGFIFLGPRWRSAGGGGGRGRGQGSSLARRWARRVLAAASRDRASPWSRSLSVPPASRASRAVIAASRTGRLVESSPSRRSSNRSSGLRGSVSVGGGSGSSAASGWSGEASGTGPGGGGSPGSWRATAGKVRLYPTSGARTTAASAIAVMNRARASSPTINPRARRPARSDTSTGEGGRGPAAPAGTVPGTPAWRGGGPGRGARAFERDADGLNAAAAIASGGDWPGTRWTAPSPRCWRSVETSNDARHAGHARASRGTSPRQLWHRPNRFATPGVREASAQN